jgi:hypothetical protein
VALELPFNTLHLSQIVQLPIDVECTGKSQVTKISSPCETSDFFIPSPLRNECSALVFPLRIVSNRNQGIAFQLWPTASVFADFMLRMQFDQTAAIPLKASNFSRQKTTPKQIQVQLHPDVSLISDLLSLQDVSSLPSVSDWWYGKRVLELGAGCGLNGMLAAWLGAIVTLSDIPGVMAHLQANIGSDCDTTI